MNIMRKLRGGVANAASSASNKESLESAATSPHTQLGMMHLKKLFSEYTHPPHPLTEAEKEDKLYNMLPLFCKVFGSSPSCDMNEKFWDILGFCLQVSLLMVSEIRKRASNQSTVAASSAIAKFLEIENCEESSNGWMLLSTLNLLAAGDSTLVQIMSEVSVPSTLVKCLYLFFDLAEIPDEEANRKDANSDFTPKERRILLQKIFVQLLVRLCSHKVPAEELARKDDLTLLFSAITSPCPHYNFMWRKSAAEVLMTLSRHGLSPPVVGYIHSKGCVAICMDNMQGMPDLAPLELVEMFVTVFCFLKDSSEVSSVLLDDFRQAQGYLFLSDILLKYETGDHATTKLTFRNPSSRLENEAATDSQEAIRNLVLMVTSLCMCGFMELKPSQASTGSLFQMHGFSLPQPSGRGTSVRNIQAFHVLQTTFIKSSSPILCASILEAISSIYHSDNANYFILENQNTLSQFLEKIHYKSPEIQEKLFELIEFLVFQLNFVPCKELISMSIFLKTHSLNHVDCSIKCIRVLMNVLKHNVIFKDVYREVGMLEVFVTCLNRYTDLLKIRKKAHDCGNEYNLSTEQERFGSMVIEILTTLLSANTANANVLRESGGAQCLHELVTFSECRQNVLGIIRELVVSTGGEEDMSQLLGTLHSTSRNQLQLKTDVLKALLLCLRDSHRTRTVFRKVNGFIYVTSVLVALEGKLTIRKPNVEILTLLNIVFYTISTAMRFEPANAKFFYHEICMTSLCDTLRLLGCFTTHKVDQLSDSKEEAPNSDFQDLYHNLFIGNIINPEIPDDIPCTLAYATMIFRLLYDVALDLFDKPNLSAENLTKTPSLSKQVSMERSNSSGYGKRSAVNSLNLNPPTPDPIIVHPGVVVVMLQLLPCLESQEDASKCLALQYYVAEIIKSLVRSERNQQIMCDSGFVNHLLTIGSVPLQNENHPLHSPLQYMLERLAAQALEPTDLRNFLRLGNPLSCLPLSSAVAGGGPVPLTRIKTIVSMTTPKDFRAQSICMLPPFVEFDMSAEGFGCLYLPSIAPQSPNAPSVVSIDNAILGGIGAGDRIFPPQTGLTFSTWICVDKFSDPRTDPHCVRLLTLLRSLNNAKDDHLVCLSIVLSARDKAIIVSTQETHIPNHVGEWEPEGSGEHGTRVWCPDILQEGQWHHLVVVLNRAVLKNSSFSLYLDGQHMQSHKLHYISQNPGGGSTNLTVATSVYGFIGTPPAWRRYSKLCWKQGPCHLVEEVLNPTTVNQIYQLGPHYMGSFQAPSNGSNSELIQFVSEEKVIFGLNAKAVSQLTLSKIRKVYSRTDNKSIAKQLGMSSHENATPIRILHNSAGHLAGSSRSLGGVVIGYIGVRVFCPRPVVTVVDSVGGCSVLLGLIAMAQDIESLYASVKALVCVVRSNSVAQAEMDKRRGYQTLAMLLRRKKPLLNSHILHLAFSLVGTVDSGRETSTIPNVPAFQDLLCDLDVWHEAPGELLRSHLEHLYELAAECSEKRNNTWMMRDLNLVTKLLHITPEVKHFATRQVLFSLLTTLLTGQPKQSDLLWYGQFVASTLPIQTMDRFEREIEDENVLLRNRCLTLIHTILFTSKNAVSLMVCDELAKTLGYDWILLFLQPNLHSSTVILGMRILVVMCSVPALLNRFREGNSNGGWLRHTELVTHSKMSMMLGYQIKTSSFSSPDAKAETLHVPGFQYLGWLLPSQVEISEIYYLLTALVMGQPAKHLPSESKFDLDTVWSFLWGTSVNNQPVSSIAPRVNLCPEAIVALLGMARTMVHSDQNVLPFPLKNHSISIIQVLFQLYHNMPEFMPIFMSAEVLSALAGVIFTPVNPESSNSSGASTPDECETIVMVPRSPTEPSNLTTHPARQFVIDFIRVIVVDSLSLNMSGKSAVIDLVLDAYPENSSITQQSSYQTEILVTLMDHLLAADMLVGDQAAIPIVPLPNAHVQHVAPNVFYLTSRIVDKLWQGILNKDPHEVFDFIVKLIGQAKQRSGNLVLECLYHCLNRSILFLLSRPTDNIADQMSVLEALHKLTTNRLTVFGAGNHELDFVGCLSYCLLQLTADMKIMLDVNMRTTWHVNPSSDLESQDDQLNAHQGRNLMAGAALRVWEELYVCKKPAIEEVFKITLVAPSPTSKAPELTIVREQIFEAAMKVWLNYIESERKASYRVPSELQNQIQSKIHKVTGGLTRLASRTKVRKDDIAKITVKVNRKRAMSSVFTHISLIKELAEIRRNQHTTMAQHMQRYVHQEWLQTETELTRERGLWGSPLPCSLDKWMLDMTEGPHRMRKKTMKNDLFYLHYPYRPEYEKGLLKHKVATSHHSKEYFTAVQKRQLHGVSGLSDLERADSICEEASPIPTMQTLPHLARLKSDPDDQQDDAETEEEQQPPPDIQTVLRLLEENEKISYMFRCARIQGLDTMEGLLLFGQEHCYVVDGFTLLKSREIRDIEAVAPHGYEPILPNPGSPRRSRSMRQCSKFSYEDIREVHKRRYLLQPMALEVFSRDGRNYLLAFPRKVRNKVYQRFMATATGIADNAQQSVAGQKRTANVEQAAGILSNLIGETSVTQRWVRGEISNFQYLMHLNTLAGRSYNDLMQYPVFPWILADYDSEELDLNDPSTFRDFTKPMGAQSPERLEQFKKRFKEWDDPHGETPPYHYGTHYSSAMIVCSYLVRMEPFTQHFLRLQGGHFDLADRMFHSIKEAWYSASKHNMADVKELIPEFFYLPEFLVNSNQFDLGSKQSGVYLGDTVLPPWAKQDPREFIRAHRMALECDYVSQHLHHWIDLIFGYKQQGMQAVDAVNVFHHLFYEGNVDIYNIDDPLKKNATIGFINNFGQIPKQLFKKPHPSKKMGGGNNRSSVIDTGALVQAFSLPPPERLFFHHLDNLRPSLQPIKEVKSPVGQILHMDKTVLAVEQNKVLIPPTYNKYVAWGFADHSLRIGHYDSDKAIFVSETVVQNSGEIVACVCPSSKMIVTAGTSSVVSIWEYEARKKQLSIKHSLYAHTEAVTCLAVSPVYNVIISGSRDSTAIVWDLSRGLFVRQLRGHAGPVAAVAVNDLTGDIATCAATWLHVWSINGDELACVNTCVGTADRMQQILCVAFSQTHEWDAANVIMTGSTDGVARMWSMDYVQVPQDDKEAGCSAKSTPTHKNSEEHKPLHNRLVKQVNVFHDSCSLTKSGSENSLSDGSKTDSPKSKLDGCSSSKEWRTELEDEKETCSDTEEASKPPVPVRRRRSRVHVGLTKSGNSADNDSLDVDDGSGIRTSKSDTSLTDSFIMVSEIKKKATNPLHALRSGFKWQRQLVFRSKLTMHTAYDRKDNAEPASITALAVSKDHRTVYVGDARGRVFSWSVCEVPGRAADHWLKDEGADYCAGCNVKFTIYERKHHCRNCGQVFCSKCSRFESEISRLRILKPVRVCQSCYALLKTDK
ncbi:PREDICTED: WD repeat and FYVE domain-containing protein 3 isoform X2 [Nicrophorus vespilloides]|uniref:WD repeat and FYVE domain-containing protein 3 isoform X2 n=1 Tax=Nicrophorus vespilloides TaxID=110193 RepID=A0ABM1MMR6_NICVS|nr:PREDICTED: WD repeat and FYVE domain-containing protein 3 isoform X2 [Nicrophorus vespilloides]